MVCELNEHDCVMLSLGRSGQSRCIGPERRVNLTLNSSNYQRLDSHRDYLLHFNCTAEMTAISLRAG